MSLSPTTARRRRSVTAIVGIVLAVIALSFTAGLSHAPPASAHTLTPDLAWKEANELGSLMIDPGDSRTRYISYKVITCQRLFAHQFRCKIGYDTPMTSKTRYWACTELVVVYYKAHDDYRWDYTVNHARPKESHGC